MKIVDLHVHSNKSDGTLSPSELVDLAVQKGLSAFALTDHDTTAGLDEAIEYAKGRNIEVIPGIEFSTEYEDRDIHVLGLAIEYHSPVFAQQIQAFVDSRILRNRKMCSLLSEAGIDITYEKLMASFPGAVVTRAHYGRYLLENGYVKSIPEAFERYIGDHAPCFVPREKVTPAQAVALIRKAKGIPVLAHPTLYHMSKDALQKLVSSLLAPGLVGIEAVYSTYSAGEEREMRQLASRNGLLISGGSDFHGSNKPGLELATGYHGRLVIPFDIWERLKEKRRALYEN